MTASRAFGSTAPTTSPIFERSPFAAWIPLVNSPSSSTPSPASWVRMGKRTVPSAFLAAVAPLESFCSWSSNAP